MAGWNMEDEGAVVVLMSNEEALRREAKSIIRARIGECEHMIDRVAKALYTQIEEVQRRNAAKSAGVKTGKPNVDVDRERRRKVVDERRQLAQEQQKYAREQRELKKIALDLEEQKRKVAWEQHCLMEKKELQRRSSKVEERCRAARQHRAARDKRIRIAREKAMHQRDKKWQKNIRRIVAEQENEPERRCIHQHEDPTTMWEGHHAKRAETVRKKREKRHEQLERFEQRKKWENEALIEANDLRRARTRALGEAQSVTDEKHLQAQARRRARRDAALEVRKREEALDRAAKKQNAADAALKKRERMQTQEAARVEHIINKRAARERRRHTALAQRDLYETEQKVKAIAAKEKQKHRLQLVKDRNALRRTLLTAKRAAVETQVAARLDEAERLRSLKLHQQQKSAAQRAALRQVLRDIQDPDFVADIMKDLNLDSGVVHIKSEDDNYEGTSVQETMKDVGDTNTNPN